jgi:hypothetical protein
VEQAAQTPVRTTITGAQLYAILDREFRRLKPKECQRCSVPLPYYRKPPDDVSANWQIGTPSECPNNCHVVIAEMLTRLWTLYDIQPEQAS